jgi:hypothetical protein
MEQMTAEQAAEWGKTLSFEKVWAMMAKSDDRLAKIEAMIAATDAQIKATDTQIKATDTQIKATDAQFAKTEAQLAKTSKEVDRMCKRVDHVCGNLGGLGNRFGEMIESMVIPNLIDKFAKLGLHFTRVHRDTKIEDPALNICTEIDAFLENGEKAVITEIKSKPDKYDIDYHVGRMEKLRKYADLHDDKRKYLGAIAGVTFGADEKNYALQQGFYVIEPSGDTFNITVPKDNPREW